ncbi:MAG: DUF86 domain-containing protein [Candidatus Eremiobacteraeota bacterium]|nr:DUF86 domain-containing protein [Candidatus Eremiobacteraeota bacterium]
MLAEITLADFRRDAIREKAARYDIQCMSEATARLLECDPQIVKRHPNVPWQQIRAISNVIRHRYGKVDAFIIWDAVTRNDLTDLVAIAAQELAAVRMRNASHVDWNRISSAL